METDVAPLVRATDAGAEMTDSHWATLGNVLTRVTKPPTRGHEPWLTRALVLALGLGGLLAAAWLFPARAHADVYETAYLETLHQNGIFSLSGDYALVRGGRSVCTSFAQGYSFVEIVSMLDADNPGLRVGDAGTIIGAATAMFCPSHEPAPTVASPESTVA